MTNDEMIETYHDRGTQNWDVPHWLGTQLLTLMWLGHTNLGTLVFLMLWHTYLIWISLMLVLFVNDVMSIWIMQLTWWIFINYVMRNVCSSMLHDYCITNVVRLSSPCFYRFWISSWNFQFLRNFRFVKILCNNYILSHHICLWWYFITAVHIHT